MRGWAAVSALTGRAVRTAGSAVRVAVPTPARGSGRTSRTEE